MKPLRTGIVGCGNIGSAIAAFLSNETGFLLHTLTDNREEAAAQLVSKLPAGPIIVSLKEALQINDVVVECAGRQAVTEMLKTGLPDRDGLVIIFLSSGGLIEDMPRLLRLERTRIRIPSGALAGIDAIRAVAGSIRSFSLTTTKPAASLASAPYVKRRGIRLNDLEKEETIFEGNLGEAIEGFPENINVAATLCLAARSSDLQIRIVADPKARFNTHRVSCSGPFGAIETQTCNMPSENPKTSQLAIDSTKVLLLELVQNVQVGT